ncbi:LacI family DNA-binding transcriptional regulator [Roseibium sp.]|uniref:LacI family DNA-binding transcriptional regulator n=1 Tax=Roseibium sp. TaxID=1936156 RepID=UPI003A96B373
MSDTQDKERASVTISDVARHVGVAKGTVSRVLNNYTDISAATRERILKAVEELGYHPSSTARSLKRGRQDTIGLVMPLGRGRGADPFLAEFIDGIARALDDLNLDLLISTAHSAQDIVQAHERLMARRKVDGFILTRTEVDDPRVNFLLARKFPFIALGRTRNAEAYSWLDVDNEKAFVEGVEHVADLGHSRIGMISGPIDLNFACQRLDGYRKSVGRHGLVLSDELEVEQPLTEEGGALGASQLLAAALPPTAILCATDAQAIGAMRQCGVMGLTVGKDVTIIGYDGLPVGAYLDPPLTTFSQSAQEAGGTIASMLIAEIEKPLAPPTQRLVSATLVRRGSDGPPARTPQELAAFLRH